MFNVSDLVVINNDPNKIIFVVETINQEEVVLSGYIYRIKLKSNINEISLADEKQIQKENKLLTKSFDRTIKLKTREKTKAIFGTVLHIDSDKKFLESCLNLYKEMKIHAWGIHLKEEEIYKYIDNIISEITPDIIVLTGHDYFNKKDDKDLNNYENTNKYIKALRIIRQRFNSDSVIVIAGACCSHFEALIANGANFASSPKRIHIHTYDPAVIAIKCATTSCNQTIDFNNLIKYIENGKDAYGGIETKGKMKLLL